MGKTSLEERTKNKSRHYEPHRDIVFKKLMIAGPYLEGKLEQYETFFHRKLET